MGPVWVLLMILTWLSYAFLPEGAPEVARNPCCLQVHVQEFSKQRVDLGVEIPGGKC